MLHDINICSKCELYAQLVTLQRCWRCLDLSCQHNIADGVCASRNLGAIFMVDCIRKEKKKVLNAWRDELNKSGICVGYSYELNKCCTYVEKTKDGEWACHFCKKRVGKIPPPNSCAGCGGHSVDPDCPLHGEKYYE